MCGDASLLVSTAADVETAQQQEPHATSVRRINERDMT
jgi:hypothetical protein